VEAESTPRLSDGVRAALPIAPGPLLFGASFGLLAAEAGISGGAALLMSATTFAGAAQFAAAGVLETGGGALAAIVAASLPTRATSRSASRSRASSPGLRCAGSSSRS
jgi:predicted branched-subunit amino acid permease